jgi:hypothetical protein
VWAVGAGFGVDLGEEKRLLESEEREGKDMN